MSCRVTVHTSAPGAMEEESTVTSLGIQRQIPGHSEQEPSHGTRRRNRVRKNYTGKCIK